MELAEGVFVTSNVRLARPLGEGGMGAVWAADHLGLDTEVAVKFIHAHALDKDPSLADRFKLEASIAAKLRSPHVVQVLDHGRMEDGTPFIVMELLEGEDLETRLERQALNDSELVLMVSQVAEVLERAHALGVVHRDLKPENLFIIDSGYEIFVKVLDFGVAKHTQLPAQSMTTTGSMVGTPVYMSPELIESAKHADHHADLWALAVVAYEALVGQMPFSGETLGSLCIAISKAEFPAPSRLTPDVSPDVDAFFARALARDRDERFASARELAFAFADAMCVAPRSSLTTPLSTGRRSSRVSRSRRTGAESAPTSLRDTEAAPSQSVISLPPRVSGPTFSPASSTKPAESETKRRPWLFVALAGVVAAGWGVHRLTRSPPVAHPASSSEPALTADVTAATDPPLPGPTGATAAAPASVVPATIASTASQNDERPPPSFRTSPPPTTQPSAPVADTGGECFYVKDGKLVLRTDRPECNKRKPPP